MGGEGDSIYIEAKDVALGYSFLAQYYAGIISGSILEDDGVEVPMLIENKAAGTGACMAAMPQHDVPAQLVKCTPCIN